MITADKVKDIIKEIASFTDEQLIHLYKIAISKDKPADKKAFEPLATAATRERKKRGTVTTISSKIISPKTPTKNDNYFDPDE